MTTELEIALRKLLIIFYKKSGHLPLSSDLDEAVATLQPEIERLVVEARIDEVDNTRFIYPGNVKEPKLLEQYRVHRIKELTQQNQKEGK